MDEFKFSDSIEEGTGKKSGGLNFNSPYVYWGIIAGAAIIAFIVVFCITNALFGPKKDKNEEVSTTTELKVNSDAVQELYSYVNYGTNGTRNDMFIKSKSVKLDDFKNEEKFYYALQFVKQTDFKDIGAKDTSGNEIYTLSSDLIKKYMKLMFGEKVTYEDVTGLKYTFGFSMGNNNTGVLDYDNARAAYTISFTSNESVTSDKVIQDYYGEVTSAVSDSSDNTVTIKETILYATGENVVGSTDIYDVSFYRDYEKTKLIGTKTGVTKEILDKTPIEVSDYSKNANVVTYVFAKNYSGNYYFVSSKLKY